MKTVVERAAVAAEVSGREVGAAIRLCGVTKRYGDLTAVDDLSLEIATSSTVALLGPNGAGKSTTVGMLMGLVRPDAGEAVVGGRAPRAAVSSGGIAAMLQDCGLMPGVTIGELVELGRRSYPRPLRAGEALELAGLSGLAKRRVDRLSGGQVQRAKFALVAVANPEVMLLDEPTRALDVQGRREFWTAMRAYAATGRTVVFATHYLDEVEENADRVVMMARGRIVADGTPAAIRAKSGGATVRFRLPVTQAAANDPLRQLAAVPGVVSIAGEWVNVLTPDSDAVVRTLTHSDLPWRDLSVLPPSLDDSFLQLTGE